MSTLHFRKAGSSQLGTVFISEDAPFICSAAKWNIVVALRLPDLGLMGAVVPSCEEVTGVRKTEISLQAGKQNKYTSFRDTPEQWRISNSCDTSASSSCSESGLSKSP